MINRLLIVVGSIPHGGPIELFLVFSCPTTGIRHDVVYAILSMGWCI